MLNALGIREIAYLDRHMLKSQKLIGSGSAPPNVKFRVSSLAYRFHQALNPPIPHHSTVRSIVASIDSCWFRSPSQKSLSENLEIFSILVTSVRVLTLYRFDLPVLRLWMETGSMLAAMARFSHSFHHEIRLFICFEQSLPRLCRKTSASWSPKSSMLSETYESQASAFCNPESF